MSNKYTITKEEINQILLHSPYALSTTPSKNGLSGEQTKRYFYDFIPVLVEKLNLKMEDLKRTEDTNREVVDEIWEAITRLGATIAKTTDKATEAYDLATGKSKVHVWGNVRHLFGDILNSLNNESKNLRVGDFILITTKGAPDFIVISSPDDVKIPPSGYVTVTAENYMDIEITEGTSYAFLNGFALIGVETGIDTSVFATKEELESYYSLNNVNEFRSGDLNDLNKETDVGAYVLWGSLISNGSIKNAPPVAINGRLLVEKVGAGGILQTFRGVDIAHKNGCEYHRDGYLQMSTNTFVWGNWSRFVNEAEFEEVESIAKGANQAVSFWSYEEMVEAFNNAGLNDYNVGQSIFINTMKVPDLWVLMRLDTSEQFNYTDDDTIVGLLHREGAIRVGYYWLAALDSQKVDLTDYATKEELTSEISTVNNLVKIGEETVTEEGTYKVTIPFDYPVNEFYVVANIQSDATTAKRIVVRENIGSQRVQYFMYISNFSSGDSMRVWTCHAKEVVAKDNENGILSQWETISPVARYDAIGTAPKQAYYNWTERADYMPRYAESIEIYFGSETENIQFMPGSKITVYGRRAPQ